MTDTASATTALFDTPAATPPAADSAPATPPSTPPAAPAPSVTPSEPWLKVNDRTVYNSKDDAIKGYTELQNSYTSLKGFEVLMKPVAQGGFGLTAEQAIAHLDSYANQLAAQQSQATPAANKSDAATVDAAAKGDKLAYDSLTPEWKAHVDYLKKLGYVTTDALKPLEDRVNAIDARSQAAYIAEVNNAVANGTQLLEATMKEAGITPDDKMLERIGNIVGSAIDRESYDQNGRMIPGSVADRFLRGNESARKQIIQEQFDIFRQFGDVFHKSQNAALVTQKTAAQSQATRTLPPSNGTPPPANKGRLDPAERARRVTEMLEASHA